MQFSHENARHNILNSELNKLSAWFAANKLSLNISKTKFMVFRPRQKRLCYMYDYDISINGEALTQVSEALFLGVLLDDCLSWKYHISLVAPGKGGTRYIPGWGGAARTLIP